MGVERYAEEVEMEAWGNSAAICLRLDEQAKKKKLSSFRRFSTPTNPTPLNDDHNSCSSTIARLERVDADELFVSPLTLQSFTCESFTKAVGNLLEKIFFINPQFLFLITTKLSFKKQN